MKYELSISANYLSGNKGWDVWAGIREIIQNGRDAEIEHKAALTVKYIPESSTLVVENEGCTIPRDALLMGHSTKRENRAMAGYFGEGLKLGALVLCRAGARVKIRTGGEVWTPRIEMSEKFNGHSVLVVDVEGGREDRNRVRVEIQGISKENWLAIKDRFLFLEGREVDKIHTEAGDLLCSPRFKGRIYVKGIFVKEWKELSYGYNFTHVELDRDRRVMDIYDLRTAMAKVWANAVEAGTDETAIDLYGLLERGAEDVKGIDSSYRASILPREFLDMACARFLARHGKSAIPVANLAESKDVEHLGAKGIVTEGPLAQVLAAKLGDAEAVKKSLSEEVVRRYSWSDLTSKEKENLERAIGLVERGSGGTNLVHVLDVVDFRSKKFRGQHKEGRNLLAREILADGHLCLRVLVHEEAHRAGDDGDKSHVSRIEQIWSAIVEHLS